MKLILASSSKYRRALLEERGLNVHSVSPDMDEESVKKELELENLTPKAYALKLAEAKALSVLKLHPDSTIIGCDQVCVFNGKVTHKPLTREKNIAQLLAMSGHEHFLFTCVCIVNANQKVLFSDTTELKMKSLSEKQIAEYVDLDQPLDCAGGYKYEMNGHKLFESVKNEDPTAIQGLPLQQTLQILKKDFKIKI